MSIPIRDIGAAFHLLYENILDRDFRKTLAMNAWSERELLPSIRTFLLGRFGHVIPEQRVKLPGKSFGRVDFAIGGVAVEFALRRPGDDKCKVSDRVNADELKKLLLYDGPALLVLFDYSKEPLSADDLERFRNWPSLGKGKWKKSGFNISYHSRGSKRTADPLRVSKRILV